jgi:anti-sigma factor RsiW
MSTYVNQTTETQSIEVCTCPAVGALLPDYIVELLEDPVAEKVERHLVDCRHCKEKYLTILRVRGRARNARHRRDGDGNVMRDAPVREVAGLSKERH